MTEVSCEHRIDFQSTACFICIHIPLPFQEKKCHENEWSSKMTCDMQFRSFQKKPLIILNKKIIPFTQATNVPRLLLMKHLSKIMVDWIFLWIFMKATGLHSKKKWYRLQKISHPFLHKSNHSQGPRSTTQIQDDVVWPLTFIFDILLLQVGL